MKKITYSIVLILFVSFSPNVKALSNNQCHQIYKQKHFLKSAKCFYKLCRKIYRYRQFQAAANCFFLHSKKLNSKNHFRMRKYYKSLFWWGAIIALTKVSQQASSSKATWFREKALFLLRRYFKEKLYKYGKSRLSVIKMEQKLLTLIAYGKIKLNTGHADAITCIQGYGFKKCLTGKQFSLKLRPGRYHLFIRYPGNPPVFKKSTLILGKKQSSSLIFVSPASARVSLMINSRPQNAKVFIDNHYRGLTPLKLFLQVGARKVEVKKGCYHVFTRVLVVQTSQKNTLFATLKMEDIYKNWLIAKKKQKSQQLFAWILLTGGSLFSVAGGISHLIANAKHDFALHSVEPFEYQKFAEEGNSYRTFGYVGLTGGLSITGAGAFWLISQKLPSIQSLSCKVPISNHQTPK